MELDPGGIGKGYAVDRMVDVLRQQGFQIALVAGSDSTIYGMGAPPTEPKGWRVGIKDPRNPRRTVAEVFLKDMSLSTSGSYEKFFREKGRTYAHIMDPRTGYPAPGSGSVSVIAPRTIDSEAWAKPYFINGLLWTRCTSRRSSGSASAKAKWNSLARGSLDRRLSNSRTAKQCRLRLRVRAEFYDKASEGRSVMGRGQLASAA